MAGSHWEEATAWEDTGGIPASPEGHPSAQPCSCARSTADRSCFRKMWTSLTPGTVPPWGRMCISSPGKIPSRGVVPVWNPHQPHPNSCPLPKDHVFQWEGFGEVPFQQVAEETLPHTAASAENPSAGGTAKMLGGQNTASLLVLLFSFFFFQPKVVSCSNGNFQERYWRDNLCKCQPSSCTTCSVCA